MEAGLQAGKRGAGDGAKGWTSIEAREEEEKEEEVSIIFIAMALLEAFAGITTMTGRRIELMPLLIADLTFAGAVFQDPAGKYA